LINSVLPTQVGHKNKKLQSGLCSSQIPALLLIIDFVIASIASSCPIICFFNSLGNFFNLSISFPLRFDVGIQVAILKTF
jgi:hypothetical protein